MFPKMFFSVIWGRCYRTDLFSSVHVSDDIKKNGLRRRDWRLRITRDWSIAFVSRTSIRLRLQMASQAQDGRAFVYVRDFVFVFAQTRGEVEARRPSLLTGCDDGVQVVEVWIDCVCCPDSLLMVGLHIWVRHVSWFVVRSRDPAVDSSVSVGNDREKTPPQECVSYFVSFSRARSHTFIYNKDKKLFAYPVTLGRVLCERSFC